MFARLLASASLISLALSSAVAAKSDRRAPPPQTDWTVTVGLAPVYTPIFQGAKDYGFSVFPDLRLNHRDDFFASVPDGIGYNVINTGGWKAGPLVKLRFGRREVTGGSPFLISGGTNALRGMGDVGLAAEPGAFAQYTVEKIRTRLELRQGIGGHQGTVGDLNVSYVDRAGPLSYSLGPRLSYGGSDFMQTYFGIDATQSTRSGLAPYAAGGGITSYGIGGSAMMPFGDKFAMVLFAGYDRLGAPAGDSPLIRQRGDRNQISVGLGFGYRFGWDG